MTIKRNELGKTNFKDVAAGKRLAPVHPGHALLHDFIEPLRITRYRVAKLAGMQQRRIDEICAGMRAVSADTALRLGRLLGVEAQTWMNLQAQFDLENAEIQMRDRLTLEVTPLDLAAWPATR